MFGVPICVILINIPRTWGSSPGDGTLSTRINIFIETVAFIRYIFQWCISLACLIFLLENTDFLRLRTHIGGYVVAWIQTMLLHGYNTFIIGICTYEIVNLNNFINIPCELQYYAMRVLYDRHIFFKDSAQLSGAMQCEVFNTR